jgi:GNAT superfamily N-acetyltransferase
MPVTLAARRLSDLSEMTARQQAEMAAYYGGRGGSGAPPRDEEFEPPDGVFLAAFLDGVVVGCGGICRHPEGDDVAEIRRMYVDPAARGQGIGARILAELEGRALALGYTAVRLETGVEQREAIRLYERYGFTPAPCWGPYLTDERSRCYIKRLAAAE